MLFWQHVKQVLKILTVLALPFSAHAQSVDSQIINDQDRFVPALAQHGMVASADKMASDIGRDILKQGGNAVDAAVATGFALAVTLPEAGNIGGGGFMLVHLSKDNRTFAIDYREIAPALASKNMYLDAEGNVVEQRVAYSRMSAGVPGTVAGLLHAQNKYGHLPLKDVLQPAINLAENGFAVSPSLYVSLLQHRDYLIKNPASAAKFFDKNGNPPAPGSNWKQPELAKTLKAILKNGRDGFYSGEVARQFVKDQQDHGGLISLSDLAGYQVKERGVIWGTYRNVRIASMPPPSSGGILLVEMLNILEGYDLASSGHNTARTLQKMIEAMRQAYADRSKYLGDPDFVKNPTKTLTSKSYADVQRDKIPDGRARSSKDVYPGIGRFDNSPSTTHFSVMDANGNAVSNTYTINYTYGSGITVPGLGFLLNNEMDDFSSKPGVPNAYGLIGGQANAVAAKKRPISSMTPTIVFKGDKPWLVTGSPGGSRIITATLQTITNMVDFNMNVAESVSAARIHHQWLPDVVYVDPEFNLDTRYLLKEMGYKTETHPWALGHTNSVVWDHGWFQGAADPRDWNAKASGF